jgi:hypothetical protein
MYGTIRYELCAKENPAIYKHFWGVLMGPKEPNIFFVGLKTKKWFSITHTKN